MRCYLRYKFTLGGRTAVRLPSLPVLGERIQAFFEEDKDYAEDKRRSQSHNNDSQSKLLSQVENRERSKRDVQS